MITSTHDAYQVMFLLDIIINKKKISENDIDYNLIKDNLLMLRDDFKNIYLQYDLNYDINNSIKNIHNELNQINFIIIEICTLKSLIINGIPLFLDVNNNIEFNKLSDEEFNESINKLITLIKSINENMKIIFVTHFIKYNNIIILEREKIFNLLSIISKNNTNCFVISPCDYINENDFLDDRHYKYDSQYKILNVISNLINNISNE